MELLNLFIKSVLASNVVLMMFLGLCPFIGVSKKTKDAVGMGMAVIFVMTMASAMTALLDSVVLKPLFLNGSTYAPALRIVLHTVTFILVIATLVQVVEMAIMKLSEPLYESLGIYLPLITTNCAVLGIALIVIKEHGELSVLACVGLSAVQGLFAGVGFMVAMLLMSAIRERLELARVPRVFKGVPVAFVCASLMALAFMGFTGLKFPTGVEKPEQEIRQKKQNVQKKITQPGDRKNVAVVDE